MQEQAPPGRAGQEGQEDATVIVSEREMEGWPGTPGQMRIERARDAREAGRGDWIFEPEAGRGRDQAILDIERLRETGMNMEFQDWAKRAFTRAMAASPAAGPLPAMREIAGEAAGEATIGLAAMNERDGRTSCSFGQLSRDPEWMGLNPALPSARGLEALVIESEDEPGRPGLVMAAPLGTLGTLGTPGTLGSAGPGAGFGAGFGAGLCIGLSQDFPPGEATVLRDILLWHGARTSWKSRAQAGEQAGERP